MIELLGLGLAVVGGMDYRRVAVLVLALTVPILVLVMAAVLALRRRRKEETLSALFCEGVASELRAGSNLADALAVTARGVEIEVDAGSAADMARQLSARLPDIGRELEATIRAAAFAGSRIGDLFDEIGSLAIAQAEISREVRVATAPAKVTASIFVGAPVAYLVAQGRFGTVGGLIESTGQQVAGSLGLGLFMVGLGLVGVIMWRAA
ncbi:MAG: hypothetical protein U9N56_00290 [Actinomycetota bacterium]|nr:hypothetical protein [Actinomycetota bacterium]